MFRHRFDQIPSDSVVLHWFLLSFNGGCVNAGGFLSTGRFVSHVTGFATLFGVDLVTSQIKIAISMLVVPLFFLLGSLIAGVLIEYPLIKRKQPHFDWVMGLSAICLFITAGAGHFDIGDFGNIERLKYTFVILALLCLACGLQNGAITSSSVRSIRTTHLTGITTDLGLGLARLFMLKFSQEKYDQEVKSNQLRLGSIVSFILGSTVGAYIFLKFGFLGFLLPAIITSYICWNEYFQKSRLA